MFDPTASDTLPCGGIGAVTSQPTRPAARRRRASHSLESVLTEAVAILDEAGGAGLTFRALAARLGGGVGSIYWYVSSRDELLDRAADFAMADVVTAIEPVATNDPIDDIRTIAVATFDAIVDRPWLGAYLMRDTVVQTNSLQIYEKIGQNVMRLGLTPREAFHATSAVVGFVIGTAADMGQELPEAVVSGAIDREDYMARAAQQWRDLDPDQFPFIHYIVEEFAVHQDVEQFRAGLELILAGLKLQAAG